RVQCGIAEELPGLARVAYGLSLAIAFEQLCGLDGCFLKTTHKGDASLLIDDGTVWNSLDAKGLERCAEAAGICGGAVDRHLVGKAALAYKLRNLGQFAAALVQANQ